MSDLVNTEDNEMVSRKLLAVLGKYLHITTINSIDNLKPGEACVSIEVVNQIKKNCPSLQELFLEFIHCLKISDLFEVDNKINK